jgi:hypothetical protein
MVEAMHGDTIIEGPMQAMSLDSVQEREAHARKLAFHSREVQEGPQRKPAMPEVQLDIHRSQAEIHMAALALAGAAEVKYFDLAA